MHLSDVKINSKTCNVCGKCVKACPEEILIKTNEGLKTKNEINCTLCMDCVDVCPKEPPAIEVSWDKNAFVFKIESTGSLPVERIVIEAFKILDKKVNNFSDQMKKGKQK